MPPGMLTHIIFPFGTTTAAVAELSDDAGESSGEESDVEDNVTASEQSDKPEDMPRDTSSAGTATVESGAESASKPTESSDAQPSDPVLREGKTGNDKAPEADEAMFSGDFCVKPYIFPFPCAAILDLLKKSNLTELSKKKIRLAMEEKFPSADMDERKVWRKVGKLERERNMYFAGCSLLPFPANSLLRSATSELHQRSD